MVSGLGKPESTFQEESLRIMANTERKRRLEAEKRLEKHISGQNLDLVFPELHPFYTGTISEDVGDDSSSNASTWDEGTCNLGFFLFHAIVLYWWITPK